MEVELARVYREEHEIRNKNPHSRNPKRVTFDNEETPNEDFVEIGPNEVMTPLKTNKQDKQKEQWLMMSLFLLTMNKSLI